MQLTDLMKKILIIFLVFGISCNNTSSKEESNKYEVVNILFNKYAKPIEPFFPPPNPGGEPFTAKDSLRIYKMIKEAKQELKKKKFIIAVYPKLIPYDGGHYKYGSKKCIEYYGIMNKLMKLKDSSVIDLNNIISSKNDSIVPFSVDLLSKDTREFIKFDYLISFSPIAFNEDYTKSIVLVSGSRSKLSGSSDLYMLEKEDGKWVIKCKINLEIS